MENAFCCNLIPVYHFSTPSWCRYLKSFHVEDKGHLSCIVTQYIYHWLLITSRTKQPGHHHQRMYCPSYPSSNVPVSAPGPEFNKKMTPIMSSLWYRKSHCGDKTVIRLSYLHNEISYIGKIILNQGPEESSPTCSLFIWIAWYKIVIRLSC